MGSGPRQVTRVVLDTNTVISALLFSGVASRLVPLWQSRRIAPLVSKAILEEYIRTLAYPKFHLTPDEIQGLVEEEILPFVQAVRAKRHLNVVNRDPDDNKFLECAVAGKATFLISGDLDLRSLGRYGSVRIVSAGEFLALIGAR